MYVEKNKYDDVAVVKMWEGTGNKIIQFCDNNLFHCHGCDSPCFNLMSFRMLCQLATIFMKLKSATGQWPVQLELIHVSVK